MKIMLVEDDPVSLALLVKSLSKIETDLVKARNGVDGWKLFKQQQPRIVISDWMLPETSGLELCKRIRACPQDSYTYIIIMTAKDNKEDVLAAFDAGADDYIAKPYDLRELHARMNTGKRIIQLEDNHQTMHRTLINSRNKIRTVFDALPQEIISVDKEMKIASMNRAALASHEGRYETHINQPLGTNPENVDASACGRTLKEMVQKTFETEKLQFFLDQFKDKEGNEVIMERTALPVLDENGMIQNITVVSRNITETHQRNEEIKRLNQRLQKASSELMKKNAKLEKTLDNLERTQTQMLQSEKMASIGQLAAGVAHEINNPTGFVSSNIKTLGDYQQDMNDLIEKYQELKDSLKKVPDGQLPEKISELLAEVEETEEDVDIAFIQEDVGELIGDCREGTERIKKIVNDLKHFAHPGEDKMKETDINAGIQSTLNVVKNELKYKATVIKELGDIPIIHAYPQQLNQVFMNILVNAAHAIEKTGEIRIVTKEVDGMAEVRISDTGCGIAEENLHKIFDPFFTTKDVGKGTGLGMNIAYNIINKHNGDIRVESTVGVGTTFIIQLPQNTEMKETIVMAGEDSVSA